MTLLHLGATNNGQLSGFGYFSMSSSSFVLDIFSGIKLETN